MSKYTVKDIENGNIPLLTSTREFREIVPMAEINLLRFLHMPGAPVIKVGRKFLINTKKMIDFMESKSVRA